ncbi:helix-turn-helix domain-containing protein [Oscillospiraceae bacterium 21-37]
MLDSKRIAAFITRSRREQGLTQAQVAEKLGVSYQAVSKWERGTIPNVEILVELAKLLQVSVDTLLAGGESWFSYEKAGIDLASLDAFKGDAASFCASDGPRAVSVPGYAPPLLDIHFPEMREPVLVMSSNTIGAKCKMAAKYGCTEVVGRDIVNDLITHTCSAGGHPLALTDNLISGNADQGLLRSLIKGISEACRENECALLGGSTCIQPQTMRLGEYTLSATIAGVVEKRKVVDGSAIKEGDIILVVASNGLHTSHYTQMRVLLEKMPQIEKERIEGETFIQHLMKPHPSYYKALKSLLGRPELHGMPVLTIGGLATNRQLYRMMPEGLTAELDLRKLRPLPFFRFLKKVSGYDESDMLYHHNCGVGLCLIVDKDSAEEIAREVGQHFDCYDLGWIKKGSEKIVMKNHVKWE